MFRIVTALAMMLALSACDLPVYTADGAVEQGSTPSVDAGARPTEAPNVRGSCGASTLQWLVGQPDSALQAMSFPASMRVIRPGTRITQDVVPGRLNVSVSGAGVITAVTCG